MFVVTAAHREAAPAAMSDETVGETSLPCVFSGCSGFLHPAAGITGVVLCSPWGYEDLTMRRSWRLLAEAVARAGYPCLRFDYPGTGNSIGAMTDPASLADWVASINAAADLLRRTFGVRQFVFVGQTLGAALAVEAARTRRDVVGLHLIAPVVKGRPHVRELSATAKLVVERLGIALELAPNEAISVMGFGLSDGMVASLNRLDLTKIETLDVEQVAIYDRIDRKASAEIAEHARRLGSRVAFEAVEPYHLMVSDATIIQPLPVAAERLVALLEAATPVKRQAAWPGLPSLPRVLLGRTFAEEPIRFGRSDALFGIMCRPLQGAGDRPAVLLLNRGLNPHIGWRRTSVDHARSLAAAGITSLRIDVAGLGESRDAAVAPQNLIYSEVLAADVRAAVDVLVARGHTRVVLVGVCSGAYMALLAGRDDPRVSHVIAVNVQRFVWNPRERLEDVIRFGLRSVNDYVGDLRSRGALKKLIRSRRRIVPALAFLARRHLGALAARVPLRLRSLVLRHSLAARVDALFSAFAAQGTRISLVFSDRDPGLAELRKYFGPLGRDMAFDNVRVLLIPDADHNLTTPRAADWMLAHIVDVVRAAAGEGADAARPPAPIGNGSFE